MIAEHQLAQVLALVEQQSAADDAQLAATLRAQIPQVHFTVCSDDDIPPRLGPAAENAVCRLYYVSSGEHCLSFTIDAQAATGLAVGRVSPDDESV